MLGGVTLFVMSNTIALQVLAMGLITWVEPWVLQFFKSNEKRKAAASLLAIIVPAVVFMLDGDLTEIEMLLAPVATGGKKLATHQVYDTVWKDRLNPKQHVRDGVAEGFDWGDEPTMPNVMILPPDSEQPRHEGWRPEPVPEPGPSTGTAFTEKLEPTKSEAEQLEDEIGVGFLFEHLEAIEQNQEAK